MTEAKPTTAMAKDGWWNRNRVALIALLPLAAIAVAASSYQYVTLYKPNEFTRLQKSDGKALFYSETFTRNKKTYQRALDISVQSASALPLAANGPQGRAAKLWRVQLEFAAKPDVPLDDCSLALVDGEGRIYGALTQDYRPDIADIPTRCVPEDAPGPTFDFNDNLKPATGKVRPSSWPVTAQFALPEGVNPAYVRVFWHKPNAALVAIK